MIFEREIYMTQGELRCLLGWAGTDNSKPELACIKLDFAAHTAWASDGKRVLACTGPADDARQAAGVVVLRTQVKSLTQYAAVRFSDRTTHVAWAGYTQAAAKRVMKFEEHDPCASGKLEARPYPVKVGRFWSRPSGTIARSSVFSTRYLGDIGLLHKAGADIVQLVLGGADWEPARLEATGQQGCFWTGIIMPVRLP